MPYSSAPPLADPRPWPLGLAAALVLIAAGLAYANSFAGAFVYDDFNAIVHNPSLRSLWPPWEAAWAPPNTTPTGRPLFNFSLALGFALSGEAPWGQHLISVLVHALAGLALLGVLRRSLAAPRLRAQLGPRSHDIALAICLLWTVHPLHAHAVAYSAQRSEALMGLFFLLTLYCAIRARHSSGLRWPLLAVLSCALGALSKEMLVAAPLLVAAHDLVFMPQPARRVAARRWRLWLALAVCCWPILLALALARPRSLSVGAGVDGIGPLDYLLTQLEVQVHYARLVFWPHPLCFDEQWPLAGGLGDVWPQALAVLAAGGLSLYALLRRSPWGFVGAWFFAILAPTSSVLPISTEVAAEHRVYLPAAGLLAAAGVLAALGLRRLARRSGRPRLLRGAAAVLVAGLVALLMLQTTRTNALYHDPLRLWRDVIAKCPDNHVAHQNLGLVLERRGRPAAARAAYQRALALEPDYTPALNNLAMLKLAEGELDEAARMLRRAVERRPDYAAAWSNLAAVRRRRGDLDGAVAALQRSLTSAANRRRADCAYNLGLALLARGRAGDADAAIAAFEQALAHALAPDAAAHFQLGRLLLERGRRAAAARHLRRCLELDPDQAAARRLLRKASP